MIIMIISRTVRHGIMTSVVHSCSRQTSEIRQDCFGTASSSNVDIIRIQLIKMRITELTILKTHLVIKTTKHYNARQMQQHYVKRFQIFRFT